MQIRKPDKSSVENRQNLRIQIWNLVEPSVEPVFCVVEVEYWPLKVGDSRRFV